MQGNWLPVVGIRSSVLRNQSPRIWFSSFLIRNSPLLTQRPDNKGAHLGPPPQKTNERLRPESTKT